MLDITEKVIEFHKVFNHPINKIGEENKDLRALRIKLLFEELSELAQASDVRTTFAKLCNGYLEKIKDSPSDYFEDGDNVNYVEELDAMCDIEYVIHGKIITSGFHHVFNEAFNEVHQSNMTKACTSEEEAKKSIEYYHQIKGEEQPIEYKKIGNKWILIRKDGKILKSKNYKKVNLEKYVKKD